MTNEVSITIPGLKKPLPGKLPSIGSSQRWVAAHDEAGRGATLAMGCALIGMCMLHVSAFKAAWASAGDPVLFGDQVFDMLLEGGAKIGGGNASIKAIMAEQRRIQELMGEKMAPYIEAVQMADFSPAQTEPETSP